MTAARKRAAGAAAALAAALALAPGIAAHADTPLFTPPAAGSYELPVIDRVADATLLSPSGARVPLLGLAQNQVALVAFVYRACSDAAGCPLALGVMKGIDEELARRPDLAKRVRLVTVSFDPEHDTPARMAELVEHMTPSTDWRFLTAASPQEIAPILGDFGQDATALTDEKGEPLGAIRHVVKLYLVDAERAVRNVYSTSLLSVPLVLTDVETVLAARKP